VNAQANARLQYEYWMEDKRTYSKPTELEWYAQFRQLEKECDHLRKYNHELVADNVALEATVKEKEEEIAFRIFLLKGTSRLNVKLMERNAALTAEAARYREALERIINYGDRTWKEEIAIKALKQTEGGGE
jgi:hypothetical protein